MKGYIPVEIPTKSYIKAYIISQLGAKPLMTREHSIGSKMCDILQHTTNQKKKEFSKRYNAVIRVYLSYDLFKRRGFNLNETNIKNFNMFLETLIKEKFYFLMNFYMEHFASIESNLVIIRKELGIDDESWTNESMRKDYYRYRMYTGKPLLYKKTLGGQSDCQKETTNAFIFDK